MGFNPVAPLPVPAAQITGQLSVAQGGTGAGAAPAGAVNLLALARQSATPNAGVALVNGTGNILTWTAPADGNVHAALLVCSQNVTSLETGGQVTLSYTSPDGTVITGSAIYPGGGAAGVTPFSTLRLIASGSTISIVQNTALTAGAASVWAQIFGL